MKLSMLVFVLGATLLGQGVPAQPPALSPPAVQASDIAIRLQRVGTVPSKINPTSPVVAQGKLLLVDQGGYLHLWEDGRATELLSPRTFPRGLTPAMFEPLMNVASHDSTSKLFVMFVSLTSPQGVRRSVSPRAESFAWYVLYEFTFDGTSLSQPRPIAALQARNDGHQGGGMIVLPDGSVLFAPGDNGDAYEDGGAYSQDPSVHLAKIIRINPADGSWKAVAVGVRNAQRLVITGMGSEARLSFVDPGGWVAEELNSVPLSELLDSPVPLNFGWGRNPRDTKTREGNSYISNRGDAIGRVMVPEAGFVAPVAEFRRDGTKAVGVTGPGATNQFSRIAFLFGDLVSGNVYAIAAPVSRGTHEVLQVQVTDGTGRPTTLAALNGGARGDHRFFNFPDGSAGVLIEGSGEFFRITEAR